jgi:hypothetical protein
MQTRHRENMLMILFMSLTIAFISVAIVNIYWSINQNTSQAVLCSYTNQSQTFNNNVLYTYDCYDDNKWVKMNSYDLNCEIENCVGIFYKKCEISKGLNNIVSTKENKCTNLKVYHFNYLALAFLPLSYIITFDYI